MATAPSRPVFHELAVADVERLTDDSVAVRFAVPDELKAAYAFDAGQSLTLRRYVDGQEHRRTYSICAPVGAAPRVGVREIPGGLFSHWLGHDVRAGDLIEVQTPTGTFRLPDAGSGEPGRHLCIAVGSGITPMLSIAATVLADPDSTLTLLYGNRHTDSVMFAEELADLKNTYPARLDLVHVLSREPRAVDLLSGRLDADRLRGLLRTLVPVTAMDHLWLCGPFEMIAEARRVLEELGVDRERVHSELFFVDEPPPTLERVDAGSSGGTGETSVVTIVLDGRRTTTPLPREETVLDAAASVRADLPFACKGGVCGTCRARVTEGRVEMARNYALDEDEVGRGFVLTCQSRPVAESVVVDFDA